MNFWKFGKEKLFTFNKIDEYQLEITTYCNAACPQCPRNINGGDVNPYLPVVHLSRETIDKAFTKEHCKNLRQIFFCGSYGDPIMHPDFLDILRDFRSKNPTLWLYAHTNGGVHDTQWWIECAQIIGGYGRIDFGIDGLEDTNHLYRRNVSFERVIDNASAFIRAGGEAWWNFIVFEHNEHQIEKAREMSKQIGFDDILFRGTGRFLNHRTLEESKTWKVTPKKEQDYNLEVTNLDEYRNASMKRLGDLKKEYPNIKDYFNETPIKCDACTGNKVSITAEGLVLPCNFFEHNLYDARFRNREFDPSSNDLHFINWRTHGGVNQVEKFINDHDKDSLNIHHTSLEQVFKNSFWQDLVDSWDKSLDNGRIFECAFTCGQKLTKVWDQNKKMTTTYRYYITGNNRGLGLELSKYFNADGSSRSSGLDITKNIDEIVEQSIHYDVFINNAFDGPPDTPWGNYGQVNLLMAIYKRWSELKKDGWIFNIGSTGEKTVVSPNPDSETYRVAKAALSYASKQCTRAYKDNIVNFKTTLITPDRLDTPLSRSRLQKYLEETGELQDSNNPQDEFTVNSHWTGSALSCTDIAEFIDYCIKMKHASVIEEVTIYANLVGGTQ